tara:strand:- start:355 stop:600 length:246 start_codon:yes stop_codon:yes gene_type:complete
MQENTSTESEKATPCPWLSQLKHYSSQETFLEYLTNHYALMAMNPKTIEQSRWRAKELKADFPILPTLIANRIKELKNAMP